MGERTYHKAHAVNSDAKLRPGIWMYWTEKNGKATDIRYTDVPKGAKVINETLIGPLP